MAMEMICGLCRGVMLVEQVGVVVECPHCGGHVRVPGPDDEPSPPPEPPKIKPKTSQPDQRSVRPSDTPTSRPKTIAPAPKPPTSKGSDPVPPPADSNPFPFFDSHEPPANSSSPPADDHPFSFFEAEQPSAAPAPKSSSPKPTSAPNTAPTPVSTPAIKPKSLKPTSVPSPRPTVPQSTTPAREPSPRKPDIAKTEVAKAPMFPLFSDVEEPATAPPPIKKSNVPVDSPVVETPVDSPESFVLADPLSDSSADVLDDMAHDESPSASQVFGAMFGEQSSPAETFAPPQPIAVEEPVAAEATSIPETLAKEVTSEVQPDSISNPLADLFASPSDSAPADDDREQHETKTADEIPSFIAAEPDEPSPVTPVIVEPIQTAAVQAELEATHASDPAPDFLQFFGADNDNITSDSDTDQPIVRVELDVSPLVPDEMDEPDNSDAPQLIEDAIREDEDEAPQFLDDADEESLSGTDSQTNESLSGTVGTESQPTLPEDALSFAMLASMTAGLPSEVTEPPRDIVEASNETEIIAIDSELLPQQYADADQTTPEFAVLVDQPESPVLVESPADEVAVADEPVVSHFDELASDESPIADSLAETFHEDEPQVFGDSELAGESSAATVAADFSRIAPKRETDGYVWISKGKLTMLMAYAAAITLGFVMVLFRFLQSGAAGGGGSSGSDLESLPDLAPPKMKTGFLISPEADMPAGHDLKIGDSQRFGNIQVTVQKVTRGPLTFTHFKVPGKERLPTAPVLKLWLKFENVSKDQEIAPLDEGLLFWRSGKNRLDWRGNQFVCRAASKPKKSSQRVLAYDHPFKDEWNLVNLPLGKPLKPGESREMYVPTSENDLDGLTGDLIWRVHFRKGFGPKGRGVTTVFEVQFESTAITDEAA